MGTVTEPQSAALPGHEGGAAPVPAAETAAAQPATEAALLKRQRVASQLFLGAWMALVTWAGVTLATAWPYELLRPVYGLLIGLPGMAFRGFDLAWMRWRACRLVGWRRGLARLVAVPLGLLVAPVDMLDRYSMARFERALTPVVAQLHAHAAAPCAQSTAQAGGPTLAEYLEESDAPRRPGSLHHGNGRFVLELMGGSADFDGSTIYYDSGLRRWTKFHNDHRERRDAFATLVQGMETCRFDLR